MRCCAEKMRSVCWMPPAHEKFDRITLCRPFDLAVRVAFMTAKKGQNVLLSPASASFDQFKSYEERGERFAQLMKELADEQTALARSGQRGPDEKESDVEEGEI